MPKFTLAYKYYSQTEHKKFKKIRIFFVQLSFSDEIINDSPSMKQNLLSTPVAAYVTQGFSWDMLGTCRRS